MFTRVNDIDRMFGTMGMLRNKMNRIFGDFDRSLDYGQGLTLSSSGPRTNLYEDGDTFEIRVEVPGISKDDLNIKIQGNYLEVGGKRSVDTPDEYKVHRSEIGGSTFSRSFILPDDVDAEMAEAKMKDGILYLTLPKSKTAKPKQITIN